MKDLKRLTETLSKALKEFYEVPLDESINLELEYFGKQDGLDRYELDGIEFFVAEDEDLQNAIEICIDEEFMPEWKENSDAVAFSIDCVDFIEGKDEKGFVGITVFGEDSNLDEAINEVSIQTARRVRRKRQDNIKTADAEVAKAKQNLDAVSKPTYSFGKQATKRRKLEKEFAQARDLQKLARLDYAKSKDLYDNKEQRYLKDCKERAQKFEELQTEYVEQILELLIADGWKALGNPGYYGFAYTKYIQPLDMKVYCKGGENAGFYSIGFTVGEDEDRLASHIEVPKDKHNQPADTICLDPRYDGDTAEEVWEQYITFVKSTIELINDYIEEHN